MSTISYTSWMHYTWSCYEPTCYHPVITTYCSMSLDDHMEFCIISFNQCLSTTWCITIHWFLTTWWLPMASQLIVTIVSTPRDSYQWLRTISGDYPWLRSTRWLTHGFEPKTVTLIQHYLVNVTMVTHNLAFKWRRATIQIPFI